MSDALDIDEDLAGLNRLAQADLRLALAFAARAEAEADPEVAGGLARSYQRCARSYRQTLAMKARLKREAKRELRDDRASERSEADRARQLHKARVHAAVKGLIWSEHEAAEAERLESDLDDFLDDDALAEDFPATPIAAHVARLSTDLGLNAASPSPMGVEGEGQSGGLSTAEADPAQDGGGGFRPGAGAATPDPQSSG